VSHAHAQVLTGRSFFPSLIAGPFKQGLHAAFDFAIVACLIGAATSWSRGKRYVHGTAPEAMDAVGGDAAEGDAVEETPELVSAASLVTAPEGTR
jgi:hypothetical protein